MGTEIVDAVLSPALTETESPWFDFIQALVGSLAWPLVVVLAIVMFHRQLVTALANLRSLKVAGTEMSFENRVEAVIEQAKEIAIPDQEDAEANDPRMIQLIDMAAASPTGAILQAWKDLEAAARELAERAIKALPHDWSRDEGYHVDIKPSNVLYWTTSLDTTKKLASYGLLPEAELTTLEELRKLRNRAVHESEGVTVEQARSYVRVADRLTDVITGLNRTFIVNYPDVKK